MQYRELPYFEYSGSKSGFINLGDICSFLEDNGVVLTDDEAEELCEFILNKRNRFKLWPGSDEWSCWCAFTDMPKVLTHVTKSMSEYSRLFKAYGYSSNYLKALIGLAMTNKGSPLERKCAEQMRRSFGLEWGTDVRQPADVRFYERQINNYINTLQFGPDGTPRLKRGPKSQE